jgi:hypothetical protein
MSDPVEPLILDLLEWIGRVPRPYAVWEEANARGFLEQRHPPAGEAVVVVTEAGMRRVAERAATRGDARAATPTVGAPSSG